MTLDKQAVGRWPIGRNARLDELMVLVAVSAAMESGSGYDLDVLKREAARATKLWEEQQAVIAALVPQEEEVGRMVEQLRDAKPLGPGNVGVSGKTAKEAADLFERLVGIQGK